MKVVKRSAVIFTVLVFVCAAVYLNWSYDQKVKNASSAANELVNENENESTAADSGLYYTVSEEETVPEPVSGLTKSQQEEFSAIRLARETARAEAAGALEVIASTDGIAQETLTEAAMKLTQLADRTAKEGELESQIISKGFQDCVVCLSDESVTVSVACEGGLTGVAVAKITDTVVSETGYTAAELRVNEVK